MPGTVGNDAILKLFFLLLIFPPHVSSFSSHLQSFVESVRGLYGRRQMKWLFYVNAMTQGTSELAFLISA